MINKKMIILILGIVLVIPVIIHFIYKMDAPCDFLIAEISAGDLLTYLGTILGSCIALFGVIITLKGQRKNYENEIKKIFVPILTAVQKTDPILSGDYHELSYTFNFCSKNCGQGYIYNPCIAEIEISIMGLRTGSIQPTIPMVSAVKPCGEFDYYITITWSKDNINEILDKMGNCNSARLYLKAYVSGLDQFGSRCMSTLIVKDSIDFFKDKIELGLDSNKYISEVILDESIISNIWNHRNPQLSLNNDL